MKWYKSDWSGDPAVQACSPLTRYVWFEILQIMDGCTPRGYLTTAGKPKPMPAEQIAQVIRVPVEVVKAALKELVSNGVASLTDDDILFSRRMIREENRAKVNQKNGALGGNPILTNQRVSEGSDNPSVARARAFHSHSHKEEERKKAPPDPQGGIRVQGLTEILPSNIDLAFSAFRSMAEQNALKVPVKLEGDRRKKLLARVNEAGGIEPFRATVDRIAASDFLCGRKGDFMITIDWMLNAANWRKITEGNYDNRPRATNGGGGTVAPDRDFAGAFRELRSNLQKARDRGSGN